MTEKDWQRKPYFYRENGVLYVRPERKPGSRLLDSPRPFNSLNEPEQLVQPDVESGPQDVELKLDEKRIDD